MYIMNSVISMLSSMLPVRFALLIMVWVTLFGNICTRTYSLSGRLITQILSVLLPFGQMNAPSPPNSKIFFISSKDSWLTIWESLSMVNMFSAFSSPSELEIFIPSPMQRYTSAFSPK